MDIDDYELLVEVANRLSFAKVAKIKNLNPSAVSRAISKIERELGFALFYRTTRQMQPTAAGANYVATIAPLLDALKEARQQASQQTQTPKGRVHLTASTAFGNEILLPLLKKFATSLPEIELQLHLTDKNLDLIDNQIDLAVRLTDQPKGDYTCVKLMPTHYRIVAAPDWHHELSKPNDLENIDCPLLDLPGFADKWHFENRTQNMSVPINGRIRMSNAQALRKAARLGLGPALLPNWLIDEDLKQGKLIELFRDWQVTATTFDTAAWLIYPPQEFMPARVRATIDFFVKSISKR